MGNSSSTGTKNPTNQKTITASQLLNIRDSNSDTVDNLCNVVIKILNIQGVDEETEFSARCDSTTSNVILTSVVASKKISIILKPDGDKIVASIFTGYPPKEESKKLDNIKYKYTTNLDSNIVSKLGGKKKSGKKKSGKKKSGKKKSGKKKSGKKGGKKKSAKKPKK